MIPASNPAGSSEGLASSLHLDGLVSKAMPTKPAIPNFDRS